MIVGTDTSTRFAERRQRLEAAGALVETVARGTLAAALALLGRYGIGSLLLEGGATLHGAALDEDVVDFVRLYVTPHVLGGGVPVFGGRPVRTGALASRTVRPLGPDTMIEGYVHGPR